MPVNTLPHWDQERGENHPISNSGCSVKEELESPMRQCPTVRHTKMTSTCFPFPHSRGCRPQLFVGWGHHVDSYLSDLHLSHSGAVYVSIVAKRPLFSFREEGRCVCISVQAEFNPGNEQHYSEHEVGEDS